MKTEIIISAETNTKEYLELIGHLDKIKFPYKSAPKTAPMDLDNNLGYSFDWANADDSFKELMQSIHAVHRKYAAEETSGSWAKNAVANMITQYFSSHPQHPSGTLWVEVQDCIKRIAELKAAHINPYNLGDEGEISNLLDKLIHLSAQHPSEGEKETIKS